MERILVLDDRSSPFEWVGTEGRQMDSARALLYVRSLDQALLVPSIQEGFHGATAGRRRDGMKPEAAYLCAESGKRGGFFVVNLNDVSEMPRVAEPWFLNFDATVEFLPAMIPADLQKAGLDNIGKMWR
jgi:hypothetical protein